MAQLTDEQLISAYKKSESLSYSAELYNRKLPLIASLCLKFSKTKEDAEDNTGEIYEVLNRDLLKYEVRNANSWLFSVCRNHCYKKINKEKNRKVDTEINDLQLNSVEIINETDLDDKRLLEDQLNRLESSIENLKDHQKKCLKLFYMDGLSYQAIAEKEDLEIKKVKSYIQNGKRKLKLLMEKKLDEK